MRSIRLNRLEDTLDLGRAMARTLHSVQPGALLLYGGLGAGKTTLVKALVQALPGGGEAEASSPSFTVCNIYYTVPRVHHFDLYRLAPGTPDEALAESFDSDAVLSIVEWPERMAARDAPEDGLMLRLSTAREEDNRLAELAADNRLAELAVDNRLAESAANVRLAELAALGPRGERFLQTFFSEHPSYQG